MRYRDTEREVGGLLTCPTLVYLVWLCLPNLVPSPG